MFPDRVNNVTSNVIEVIRDLDIIHHVIMTPRYMKSSKRNMIA